MENKKATKVIIIISFLILFIISIFVLFDKNIIIDEWGYNYFFKNIINEGRTSIVKDITIFGGTRILLFISFICLLFFKNKKTAMLSITNLFIVFFINVLLKFFFRRGRPLDINLIIENGYSFPSGHAMISTAFYGFLIYLCYKYLKSKKLKIILITFLCLTIMLVSLSRIYLGVHYISDVVAGILFAILYLILYIKVLNKYKLME